MPHTVETGLIARYHARLPIPDDACAVSHNEGNTPLVRLNSLCDPEKGIEVFAKGDGANPTGSFKDRGMTCLLYTSPSPRDS